MKAKYQRNKKYKVKNRNMVIEIKDIFCIRGKFEYRLIINGKYENKLYKEAYLDERLEQ